MARTDIRRAVRARATVWRVLELGLALASVLLLVSSASAQEPDPISTARMHLGPLAFTPTIAVSNLGIDTNVFNSLDAPKRDFTTTLSPQAQFWLRLGQGRLSGATQLHYVHYQKYATERALSARNEVRVELPLHRITPYVSDTFINARERPGYEIDARARRVENTVRLGTEVRVGGKTSLDFAAGRTRVRFDADEVFLGTHLREVLNRTTDGVYLSLRHDLTPLTTVAIDAEAQRDRFELSPVRNADTVRVVLGLDFSPFTLITGSARAGYRKYDALGSGGRGYRGMVAAADLGYTLRGITRFAVHVERDIAYSFEVAEPYYLQTGASATITQKITPRWDVQLTGGRYNLDYQQIAPVGLGAGRTDDVRTAGGGIGYSLGPATRLGISVDRYRRSSDRETRAYRGTRVGASFSYGF